MYVQCHDSIKKHTLPISTLYLMEVKRNKLFVKEKKIFIYLSIYLISKSGKQISNGFSNILSLYSSVNVTFVLTQSCILNNSITVSCKNKKKKKQKNLPT